MKTLLLSLLFTAAALAQIPAHSVSGSLTMDVADIQVPVPYGPAESRAMITVCVSEQVSSMIFSVYYADDVFVASLNTITKTDSGYCGTTIAPLPQKRLASVNVDYTRSARVFAPPPAPTAGSTAAR